MWGKKCLKINFVKLCSFPFTNVANAVLPSNIHKQAMSTWESGCAGNDGDLGWAVKERVEEMLMIYSQEAWRLLQHRLTAQRATERTAGMKRLHARRSQEEQNKASLKFPLPWSPPRCPFQILLCHTCTVVWDPRSPGLLPPLPSMNIYCLPCIWHWRNSNEQNIKISAVVALAF